MRSTTPVSEAEGGGDATAATDRRRSRKEKRGTRPPPRRRRIPRLTNPSPDQPLAPAKAPRQPRPAQPMLRGSPRSVRILPRPCLPPPESPPLCGCLAEPKSVIRTLALRRGKRRREIRRRAGRTGARECRSAGILERRMTAPQSHRSTGNVTITSQREPTPSLQPPPPTAQRPDHLMPQSRRTVADARGHPPAQRGVFRLAVCPKSVLRTL